MMNQNRGSYADHRRIRPCHDCLRLRRFWNSVDVGRVPNEAPAPACSNRRDWREREWIDDNASIENRPRKGIGRIVNVEPFLRSTGRFVPFYHLGAEETWERRNAAIAEE